MSDEVFMQGGCLKLSLEKALKGLREKESNSAEAVITDFIALYEAALCSLDEGVPEEDAERFCVMLLGRVRQYMECSSDYGQEFLYSMSEVEQVVSAKWR
jgi:hypothetical protein